MIQTLLVERDSALAAGIAEALATHHYAVEIARDGQAGLERSLTRAYDLILLNIAVAPLEGMGLYRQLRAQAYPSPILLLTSREMNTDWVVGLDASMDDYLMTPFDVAELLTRMRALLKRRGLSSSTVLTWGNLQLDTSTGKVSIADQRLRLTRKEYGILELLLLNPNRVFSRSVMLDRLWFDAEVPNEETVNSHIKSLRKKLVAGGAIADPIETLYGLGYRLRVLPDTERSGSTNNPARDLPRQQLGASLTQLWDKYKDSFVRQVEVLEQAAMALSEGTLTPQLRLQATQEAHQLGGSFGTFGFPKGSRQVKEIEQLLQIEGEMDEVQKSRFLNLVELLRQELHHVPDWASNAPDARVDGTGVRGTVLIVDDDIVLTERLRLEAIADGFQIETAPDLEQARLAMANTRPHLVVLDLSFSNAAADGFELLAELTTQQPPIPVVVLTGSERFADRVKAARLGAKGFLQKSSTAQEVLEAIANILQQSQIPAAKLLIVDDDPRVLDVLRLILEPWGFHLTLLDDPQQFWSTLEQTQPDLLILDVEMPDISGIDLCQVVRSAPRWHQLPVLFLSAHTEADLVQRGLGAGADDYVNKPIVAAELLTRILNRLEQAKLRCR
jgi:DNA-binding response OmpR family regulator